VSVIRPLALGTFGLACVACWGLWVFRALKASRARGYFDNGTGPVYRERNPGSFRVIIGMHWVMIAVSGLMFLGIAAGTIFGVIQKVS